jgi:membrane protein CcdC involved in cytochrome C biogenesis
LGTIHFNPHVASLFATIFMALTVIAVRLRATRKPVSVKKIIMPPIGMATGFLMFLFPFMRIPFLWGVLAFLAGVLFFSYPLIRTSRFYANNGQIYLQRSRAFIFILLGLLAIRLVLHGYIEEWVTIPQTGALFFLLAFGMLLPWRLAMYIQYMRLLQESPHSKA